LSDRLRHRSYHTGDMVRERVGDWKLAWRFALAGLLAGILVIALAQTGITAGTFDAVDEMPGA
jgi:membrane associated rhomboid family serine protease